jgi:hypothetical protein
VQPSPTIAQCLNGGLGWLEVECNRCRTRASLPLDAPLKCRSCRKVRHAPPVHMVKLTETREITPIFGCIRTMIDEGNRPAPVPAKVPG